MTFVSLLVRSGLRHHRRRPLQTALAVFGIAVGVALVVALRSSLATAEAAFDRAAETVAGTATHVVTGGPDGLDERDHDRLVRELGLRGAAPSVGGVVRVADAERRIVLRAIGVDPLAERAVRPWAAPGSGDTTADVAQWTAFLTTPGAFVATAATLARLTLSVGDTLPLKVGGLRADAVCVGVIASGGALEAGLDDVLVTRLATAQEWFRRVGRIDRIDLRLVPELLPDGADPAVIASRIAATLGPAARIEPAGAEAGTLGRLTQAFRTNLQALGLLSLFVAALLVHATMRFAVVTRRRTFGVLRALGVDAARIRGLVVGEAAVMGLVGSVIGACGGLLLARAMIGPLVATMNDHYATFSLHGVATDYGVLALGVGLGVGVAIVSAVGAAHEASRVPPREALVPVHGRVAASDGRASRARWIATGVAAAVGVVLLATSGRRVDQAYAGLFVLLSAVAAAIPTVVRMLLVPVERASRRGRALLRYVVRSAQASLPRTGVAVAALVLALATSVGLGTLIGSFRDSVERWLGGALPADVYARVLGGVDERATTRFDDDVLARMRAVPGIAAESTWVRGRTVAKIGGETIDVELVGIAPSQRVARSFEFVAGDGPRALSAMAEGEGVVVAEPFAFRHSLAIGAPVELLGAAGVGRFVVAGIVRDYGSERGYVATTAAVAAARFRMRGVSAIAFEAGDGVTADELGERLRAAASAAATEQDIYVVTQQRLRHGSMELFDRSFAITGGMRLLCVVVAFLGMLGAFAALQSERGAELGVLRVLGASRRRVFAVVLGQTTMLGVAAGLVSIPVGYGLGLVLAHVVHRISFGSTLLDVGMPANAAVEALVLAVVASTLAGLQPAWRFARLRSAVALREG